MKNLTNTAFVRGFRNARLGIIWRGFIRNHASIVIFLLLFVFGSFISPSFFSLNNTANILLQYSIIGFLAIGQTAVIVSGGIDLSVGATLALSTMVSALTAPYGFLVSLLSGLAVGVAMGLINGLLVARFKMAPFIVTLATMGIARSIAALLTEGAHVTTDMYRFISNIGIGRLPFMVISWIALTVLFQYMLRSRTSLRYMLAVGGDEETARLSGIKTARTKLLAYVLAGILSSVGAIFYLARLGHGHYTLGESYNLDSIAAVAIGGTSIFGGSGSFVDTFFGVLILGVLDNIMNLLNISVYAEDAFKGAIILGVILWTVLRRSRELKKKAAGQWEVSL